MDNGDRLVRYSIRKAFREIDELLSESDFAKTNSIEYINKLIERGKKKEEAKETFKKLAKYYFSTYSPKKYLMRRDKEPVPEIVEK